MNDFASQGGATVVDERLCFSGFARQLIVVHAQTVLLVEDWSIDVKLTAASLIAILLDYQFN
jgi:hypothetical protein